jgi:sugar lactone lactonase YvrE
MAAQIPTRAINAVAGFLIAITAGSLWAQQLVVSPGTITTIAGIPGTTTVQSPNYSGPATSGSLFVAAADSAQKLAQDAAGNIYFADRYANVVRKLTPVTAIGATGNLYGGNTAYTMSTVVGAAPVACTGTINAAKGIESLAYGDGCVATAGNVSTPYAVVLNAAGTILFISDLTHGTIRAVNVSSTTQTFGSVTLTPGYIYTVAGTGVRTTPADSESGTTLATSSPIQGAHGLAMDSLGNLIISDYSANTIRKVTPGTSNIITTIVSGNTTSSAAPIIVGGGSLCTTTTLAYGSSPCGDGNIAAPPTKPSTSALVQINSPENALVDSFGNIYIADTGEYRVRLVSGGATTQTFFGVGIAAGTIGTIAGYGVFGSTGDGGNAAPNATFPTSSARLGSADQLALDAAGSLYMSDISLNEIRRIDPTGIITTITGHYGIATNCNQAVDTIGDGCPATNATLKAPTGLSIDSFGNTTILDGTNQVVRQVNVSTTTATFANTAIGSSSVPQVLTLYNTSANTVNFSGIQIPASYSQTGGTCTANTSLVAGANCTLSIVFTPQSAGMLNGTINISSNSINPLTLNLTGTGTPVSTTTTDTVTPNPSGLGQTVTFVATVTRNSTPPTGSVTFSIGSGSSGAIMLLAAGTNTSTATYSTNSLAAGIYSVTASYSGGGNFTSSSSTATSLVVSTKASTTTSLSVSPVTPAVGSSITLTATVSASGVPTGIVYFYNGNIYIGMATLDGTTASLVTTSVIAGSNSFTAVYQGDGNYLLSTSSSQVATAAQAATLLFTPGVLTTVAGNGTVGYSGDGLPSTAAQLNGVNGITVDNAGNLYLADTGNNVIRIVNTQGTAITMAGVTIPAGAIATVVGNGTKCTSTTLTACGDGAPANSASLSGPTYVKLDVAGNIYIADTGDNAVRVVNTQQIAITVTGVTIPPNAIATVAGTGTSCPSSTASPACGDTGLAIAATLKAPRGVYVDLASNIYIADSSDSRIRKVNGSTGVITSVAGTGTGGYSGDGVQATTAKIGSVHGLYVDASGQIYFADDTGDRIRTINTSGIINTIAGTGVGSNGGAGVATNVPINFPGDVAVDGAGDVYVPTQSNLVALINTGGFLSFIAGNGNSTCTAATATAPSNCYSGDGRSALQAQLYGPQSLAFDTKGNLYIAENTNSIIRKLTISSGVSAFGAQSIGSTSAPQTTTVTNVGSQPLTLSALSVPTLYTQTLTGSDCTANVGLASGASCSFSISYSPTDTVISSANASVNSNSINANAGVNLIALSGTGVQTPTALAYTVAPPAYINAAGNPGIIKVRVVDAVGRVVAADNTDTVTLTLSGPTGFTPLSFSATVVSGVATFDLSAQPLPVSGAYTYQATSGVLTSVLSMESVVANIYSATTPTGGAPASAVSVTLIFNSSATLGSTSISSLGTSSAAFAIVPGGTCSVGTPYTTGQQCTLLVQLTPTGSNLLTGKLQAYDSASTPNVLALAYVTSLRFK